MWISRIRRGWSLSEQVMTTQHLHFARATAYHRVVNNKYLAPSLLYAHNRSNKIHRELGIISKCSQCSHPKLNLKWPVSNVKFQQVEHNFLSCHSQLIIAVRGDVSYPGQGLISALFDNLQISYLDAANGEVGDLEFDSDWLLP